MKTMAMKIETEWIEATSLGVNKLGIDGTAGHSIKVRRGCCITGPSRLHIWRSLASSTYTLPFATFWWRGSNRNASHTDVVVVNPSR
jgi:hypothetical protein